VVAVEEAVRLVQALRDSICDASSALYRYVATGDKGYLEKYGACLGRAGELVKELERGWVDALHGAGALCHEAVYALAKFTSLLEGLAGLAPEAAGEAWHYLCALATFVVVHCQRK
jgi:hypothetical protein